jgi:heterodisulfide reductase subunit C
LFNGAKDNVINNISEEEVLANKNSKTKASTENLNKNIVSGNKTSESNTKKVVVEEINSSKDTNTKEIASKEVKVIENKVSNSSKKEEKKLSKDEVTKEKSNKKNKKRDNMTLLTDKELLNDENIDKDFTQAFLDAGIETVEHCFQCGTCGGGCPSGRRTPYKVRQIVRKCLLGLKEQVISDDALWMCTTCYTCQERCPRSIKIVEIIKKARNLAAQAGYMAKPHRMTGLFVITTGHGVPINPATKELRKRVGLSELPPTTHSYPEALAEVQKICEATGFDNLIGYDKSTGELKSE